MNESGDIGVSDVVVDAVAPVESSAEDVSAVESTPVETKAEKMVTKSYANSIAAKAAERARAEVEARYQSQQAQLNAAHGKSSAFDGLDPELMTQFKAMVFEAAGELDQKRQHETLVKQGQQIADEFFNKINAEAVDDPEFANLFEDLNIAQQPGLVRLLNEVEETGKVVKDLAKNPHKYVEILTLVKEGSPGLAKRQLQSLANSIKANKAGAAIKSPPEPLSQVKPSRTVQTLSDGNVSVSDFRKNPRFRG